MNKVFNFYIRLIFLLSPIVFLPIVTDAYGFGKNLIIAVLAFLGLVLWGVKLIFSKEKIIRTNKFLWLFLIFAIWSGITFFRLDVGPKMVSLMNPMGMGTIISFFILFFLWLQVDNEKENEKQFLFLTLSGMVVGVISLLVFMIPEAKLPLSLPTKNNPLLTITTNWSLAGSVLAEVSLFLFLVFGWLKKLLVKLKDKPNYQVYLIEAIVTIFFSLLFLLDVYKSIKLGWIFLDIKSAWVIAVETFKMHPIFGTGIGNFVQAFNSYRPTSFNLTSNWASIFSSSSIGFLQIWTEIGIIGLISMIYLTIMVLKQKGKNNFVKLVVFLALNLFLPLNLITLFLFLWLVLDSLGQSKEMKLILNVGEKNFNVMPYVAGVIILAIVGFGGFWMTKMFLGDFYMKKSYVAAAANDGAKTYELQIKAISFNPNMAFYRKVYSQVNLSLAQSFLSDAENISDENKEKASTLVQQSVREAKAAVSLDQNNPTYWYNLAGIYKNLTGLVDGAADWSYQAYQQTVVLDTINPTYYLDMGGLLYAGEAYDSAERAFEQAVTAKSDYANAWYNWAYAAKQQNKLAVAVNRLEQAVKLVPESSTDYENAKKDLDKWKTDLAKLIAEQEAAKKAAEEETKEQPIKESEASAPRITEEVIQ